MKIRLIGLIFEYSWTDDLGFHQYFCERIGNENEVGNIFGFERRKNKDSFVYVWNDKLGYHEYICEF
jgi:hypothetical protein